jgi:hypothetical protein
MKADAFGQLLSVTETDDPHEEMTMPAGAESVPPIEDGIVPPYMEEAANTHQASVTIPLVDPNDIDIVEGVDIVEHMYADGDVPSGLKDY